MNNSTTKKRREASPFTKRLINHCAMHAKEMAALVAEIVDDKEIQKGERDDIIAFALADELTHFYINSVKFQVSDPEGYAVIQRIVQTRHGKRSGRSRVEGSAKYKFLSWAAVELDRNPDFSKNDLAERYAKDHPGPRAATLRRYIAESGLRDD